MVLKILNKGNVVVILGLVSWIVDNVLDFDCGYFNGWE
ncbi:hypothetical protein F383_17801 [Gossypium arboreum]|uniref:Uncharacterized protein n=1 Tax=Gossypium arboreum TaxID=29729 RepID=A0A0B0NGY7_GOSAR|nr:hypothetical protein F383_17801 [Gossypium arboreum]